MLKYYYILYLWFSFLSFLVSTSHTSRALPHSNSFSKVKAVGLGGWLVTEGWIKPSLFHGIPNKDFLDGTQLQFKSVTQNKYLCAESGGGTKIVANRTSASGWETFKLWRITENTFQFRVSNWQFVGLDNKGQLVAVSNSSNPSNTFEIVRNTNDTNRVRIRAPNGLFLQVKTDISVVADYPESSDWSNTDPSVFRINIVGRLRGEFQVTNGYGANAASVMREHWKTFIVEKDFKFISENGLNSVRIPVGWWITWDTNPPFPFVSGSLQALDTAFIWAKKYGLGIIIDLHAAPGAQNGWEHSGTRDGFIGWGKTEETIDQTLAVIDFLTSRYAKSPSLLAIELLNEPWSPEVTLDSLTKYYKYGYDKVRLYTSTAYVVMSNRMSSGSIEFRTELLQFASGFQGSVIDIHYYSVFSSNFDNLTVKQNIDYVYNNMSAELSTLMFSNGPLLFVGEWVAEWKVKGASKEDYQRFAAAELNVFGRATFGWSYWTLKTGKNHWSLEWMIQHGYINLKS